MQNTVMTLTRNPNLARPQKKLTIENQVQAKFQNNWWTGLAPENCPGFDKSRNCLTALPLLNLDICSRQDVLDYFDNTWTLTELLFAGIKTEDAYTRPPYHQLRHPMMFYYGHTAVLFVNKLRLAGLLKEPINLYLEKVLETGVDEMSWDDMSKNEMNWPSIESVHAYRKTVYGLIKNLILTHPQLDPQNSRNMLLDSPLWALWMGFEHEKIHFETSSVLIRELPIDLVETPKYWAPIHPSAPKEHKFTPARGVDYQEMKWKQASAKKVKLGKPVTTPSYGWDNEYGHREVSLKDFQYSDHMITNGEYFDFVASGAYVQDEFWSAEGLQWRKFRNTKRPTFWVAVGPEGAHEYCLRTIFEFIPMPWNWPVEVNFHEAQAYCRWKQKQDKASLKYRLFSEGEFTSLARRDKDAVLQTQSYRQHDGAAKFNENFNFVWGSASEANELFYGNVWHWLEDQFNPLEGFKVHRLYDDFSTPCFDGKHQMILGGSFISCGHEASQWARFHFRPHFYQHSGFRIAATMDGSNDNSSYKINTSDSYVHPRRQNVLDQMNGADWWKNIDQPLELDQLELENILQKTNEHVLKYNQNFPQMHPMGAAHDPAINSVPKDFALAYQSTKNFPANPEAYDKLLKFIFDEMAPLSQLAGHPGYAAYVAGSGNAITNVAQMISQTLNPFSGHYMMAPGLVALEAEVINWFIDLMKFPMQTAGGFLTTGSSLATQSALSMARNHKLQTCDYSKVTLYVSDQSHHCISKAWVMLGFNPQNVRFVKTNRPDFRMDVQTLKNLISDDVAAGLSPFCVVATAGTTNTGAVDDLNAVADLADEHNMWLHVDGAYGALFMLTQAGQEKLKGIERADSVVFDLHKAMSLAYGTGCLLVKNKEHMRFNYPGAKTYMPPSISENEMNLRVDYADISPELSRDYRGLRVWLPIKTLGIGPFILNLEEKLQLSTWFNQELKKNPKVEVVADPQLTIQAFHVKVSSDLEKNNQATQKLLEKINHHGTLFVSACTIDGKKCIRLCFLSFRMHFARLEKAYNEIQKFINELS